MPLTIDPIATQRRNGLAILNETLEELGFDPTTSLADANPTVRAVLRTVNSAGEDLARKPFWTELVRTFSLVTVSGQSEYALPEDWGGPLSETAWNGSQKLYGPRTASEWQASLSGGGSGATGYHYRFAGGQVHITPTPTTALTFTQEYVSRNWVLGLNGDQTVANVAKPRLTLNTDYPLLDERVLVLGAKLAFQQLKGFDTVLTQRRFDEALELAMGASHGAPILSLVGLPARIFLSCENIPDSGYGQ